MATNTTDQNEATFYLDGTNFFPAVDAALQAVAAAPANPLTYVRMAFWMAQSDFPLTDPAAAAPTVADLLETRLREIAWAGHAVEVILYCPSATERAANYAGIGGTEASGIYEVNESVQRFLNGWPNIPTGHPARPQVRVFLEKYDRDVPGASNHQKVVICSLAGQRRVFIGGFNLLENYWDSPAHNRAHTWHDTGVALRGPATDAVEAEWMRRWAKSGLPATANPTVQTLYPVVGGQTVRVTIATTNSEGWFREADIQAALVGLIQGANNYVYFENYAFTDPTLVDALATRINAGAPPAILVNVTWPFMAQDAALLGVARPFMPYDFLDYISWMKVALRDCVSVDVPDPANPANTLTVTRATATTWRVLESWNGWSTFRSLSSTVTNRWMQDDMLEWQQPGGQVHRTLLSAIRDVTGGTRFYSTGRALDNATLERLYIHSKLALFDDDTAVVGTANFTYRSMVYDGEIVAIIQNPTIVTAIRQALLPHFNTAGGPALTPGNFAATAAANRVAYTNGTLAGGGALYVIPLERGDYSTTPPTSSGNFTWY